MMPPDWRPPTLTTPRLVLRPFCAADAEPLFEYAKNPRVTQFTLWDAHKTVAETLVFVHDYALARYREGTPEPFAITIAPDPRPVGSVGCFWVSKPHATMELGYWLAEPFWGRGYTAEACRAIVGHTFDECLPERIQARVILGNTASARVLAKLGFTFEGTLRRSLVRRGQFDDVCYFSVLRDEWPAL